MFDKKDVKLYKFNLKVVKILPLIIAGLIVIAGLVFGVLDSFVLELVLDLGSPIFSVLVYLVLSVLLAAICGGLTGVVCNAYLLHIYYLTSINNQLLANKKAAKTE
jgi:hypothetical protein